MQEHYESGAFNHQGVYEASTHYNGASVRLHHGQYQEGIDVYGGYIDQTSNNGYPPREPPPYETTMYHPSFIPNSSTSYYRMTGRQPDDSNGDIQNQYGAEETRILSELDTENETNVIVKLESEDFKSEEESSKTATSMTNISDRYDETTNHLTKEPETNKNRKEETTQIKEPETDKNRKEEPTQKDDSARGNSDIKPSMSYIALIAKAILESQHKRLSLGSIYMWIEKNYPYYLNKGQGWRNSVRHNLSLNDCFIKAGRCEDGKGNYWAIHPANIQDFMRGDFRQRRRSRRRGRKKDCDLGMYHMSSGYIGPAGNPLNPALNQALNQAPSNHNMSFNTAASLNPIYSPYTDAERRAYRLDEALMRQSITNPFMKWCNGMSNSHYSNQPVCNSGMYGNTSPQWQGYTEQAAQPMYQQNSSYMR